MSEDGWDRTQDCCVFGIGSQTLEPLSARSRPRFIDVKHTTSKFSRLGTLHKKRILSSFGNSSLTMSLVETKHDDCNNKLELVGPNMKNTNTTFSKQWLKQQYQK